MHRDWAEYLVWKKLFLYPLEMFSLSPELGASLFQIAIHYLPNYYFSSELVIYEN